MQFGFKRGFSTDLCNGVLKNVVSNYIHKGSIYVFFCMPVRHLTESIVLSCFVCRT